METSSSPAAPAAQYSPILNALSHILIFDFAYLYLRLYTRFFLFLRLMILGSIAGTYMNLPLNYLVILAAMVDTYQQVKGINEGTVKREPFSQVKHIGGFLLLLALIAASLLGGFAHLDRLSNTLR